MAESQEISFPVIHTLDIMMEKNVTQEILHKKKQANLLYSRLLNFVRMGNVEAIQTVFSSPDYTEMTAAIIGDDIDFARTVVQFLSPQIARAAIEGGVSELDSAAVYLGYLESINTAASTQELLEIHRSMLADYAGRVAFASIDIPLSPLARRCYSYIHDHVHDRITTRDIAAALHVSRSYLSHVYKSETGTTISESIYHEKVATAKILMRHTMLNIAEIAYQLAFSSQSRFTEVFHKVEGVTPGKYRDSIEKAQT